MPGSIANDNPMQGQRDFVADYEALIRRQEQFAEAKDALYTEWVIHLRARIESLHNPQTERKMSVSAFQSLLPGYDTTDPKGAIPRT